MIFYTGQGPVYNVWLLLVLNEPTYDALKQITINNAFFMGKSDFQLVTTQKIPLGAQCDYSVSAIKDKMGEKDNPIYYGVKFCFEQIYKTPTYFTISIELESTADLKALVLALGRIGICDCGTFNACSSFSKSVFIVADSTTFALVVSPLIGACSFYLIKQKRKSK
ncbi:MAG: hypothetical protein QXR45_12825 [Candidatus Bathyarchaeia archaeon]